MIDYLAGMLAGVYIGFLIGGLIMLCISVCLEWVKISILKRFGFIVVEYHKAEF